MAIRSLTSILSKRGEEIKETEVDALVKRAQKRKKCSEPSLLFNTAEWKEVVNCLWDSTIDGGKNEKEAEEFGTTCG